MILPPTLMGEGRKLPSMSVRAPDINLLEMPPQFKTDQNILKNRRQAEATSPYDHNKNTVLFPAPKERHTLPQISHSSRSNVMQPFTAPWLNEVVRMNPMRALEPPRLGFGSSSDFFPHFPGISPRAPLYPPPFMSHQHFMRDFGHSSRQSYRNLHSIDLTHDPGQSSSSLGLRQLGPPPHHPLPQPQPTQQSADLLKYHESRNPRIPLDFRESKPRIHVANVMNSLTEAYPAETSPKRAPTYIRSPSIPSPNSPSSSAMPVSSQEPLLPRSIIKSSHKAKQKGSSHYPESKDSPRNKVPDRPSSPFHPHFQKGSLVTLANGTRKIEELQTNDFVNAAEASSDLTLDPSRILAISSNSDQLTSTITFYFASTNTEIPVEASNSHPFFVFHRGWSSCEPQRTQRKYGLDVYQLRVGDVCVSLKKLETPPDESTCMPPPKTSIRQTSPPSISSESKSPPTSKPSSPESTVKTAKRSHSTITKSASEERAPKKMKLEESFLSARESLSETEEKAHKRKRRWSD